MSITLKQKNSGRVWNGTKVSSPQKNVGEKTGSGMTLTQRPQKAVQTSGAQAPASTSRDWSFFEQGRINPASRAAASQDFGGIRIPSANRTPSGSIDTETLEKYISPRDATLYDLTIGSIMRGYDNSQYGIELYKQMSGQENDADEYAKKMASEKYRFEADGLIGKAVSGASELLGQQLRQWTDPTAIAAGGTAAGAAAIAGQAGPQVLIPEEVFTVPGAFIGGLQVGSGLSNYQIEAGLAYKEMLDNGISEDTASKVATAVGGANAALELVQMDELVKSFQVLNKSGASNGVLDAVLGELKRRGMDVAKETAQEVAQEGVTITGSQVASQIDRGEWQYGAKDVVERLGDTALSSALSFGVLNVPGGVYNVAYGNRTSSPQQAQQATVAEQEPTPVETEISAPSQEQQSSAREAAILRILEENGVTGTPANRQAQGVAALIDGGELSSHRADEIRKSRAAQAAYTQITGETIDTTGRPAEVRARIKQMALDKAAERNAQNVAETIPTQATMDNTAQEAIESPVTPVISMGTVDTNQAETSPVIQYTPSPASDLDTISQRVSNINLVDRMAQDSQVLGEAGRAAAMTRYDGTTDPSGYYAGFMQAYNDGMNGKRNRQNSVLTKEQYNQAYNAGRTDSRAGLTREGAGLVRNASAVKLRDAGTIDALAKKLGVTVVAEDTIFSPDGRKSGANGYIKGREIHIALDAEDPSMVVFKHEVTHYLQEKSAKSYQKFRDYAVQAMGEDEVRRVQDLYLRGGVELTWDGAMDEVAANYTENLLTDEEAVRRLIRDDRNLAQKIMDAIRELVQKVTGQEGAQLRKAERLWTKMFEESVEMRPLTEIEQAIIFSDRDTKYSIREKDPPKKTGVAYKVFFAKDGQLYPPMVANPGGAGTPVGVWLDADIGQAAPPSKTGRMQVQAGGKGTNAAKGSLAFRPGWHLGDIPLAKQFARKNPETGVKDLFPADFVWAECEYAMDVDYQEEAMSYGYTENGKFRHSYAGLPKLPQDGYYRYRTNPNPDTVPWVITGAMKVNRILTDAETDAICRQAGVEPMKRQGGPMDEARLAELGLKAGDVTEPRYSLKSDVDQIQSRYDSINARIRELSIQKSKLEDSAEFKRFMEVVPTLKDSELMPELERYSAWEKQSGLSDVSNELKELRTQEQEAYRELQRAKARALNEAREEYRSMFTEEFSKKYASKAARKFGTTSRFDLAGYLTVNGTLLDFSERQGYRVQDHREIAEVLDFLPDYAEYSDGMIEFMNMGNIRLQSYGIDIAKAPNAKQRSMLRKFFNSLDGEVTVDFSLENGNNDGSIDYPEGTRADKILRDIDSYFSTGVVPEQSAVSMFHTRYSIKSTDSQGRQLTKEQQEYFRDSVIRDDKGHLMVMYHISDVDNISVFQSGNSAGIIYFSKSIRDARKAARGSRSIYVCYLNIKNPVNTENNPFYWYEAEDSLRVANWKREGYDGVYMKDESGVSVAVFYPGQIKETENLNPTNTTDIRFSLRQENQRLRELNQYLREEISDPSVVRTSRNGVKKLASRLVSEYDSTVDKSDISAQLLSLYDFIANGKDASGNELTWTEVSRRAKEIAQDILSGAVAQGNPLYEEYADVRSYVKQQAIVVPKDSRGDFEQFGGWGEFRKRNAGRMKLMNDGLPSDVFYQELSSQWPELFPEDIANPADQMIHTAEVLQYLDAVYENPYQQEMDVYTRYLADEILESFYEVPQRTTYAQRQQLRQTKQAIRYEKRIDSLRQRQKERIADLRAQGRDRIKQAVAEQREESAKKLDALKRKYQGKEAATRDRREAAATRAKIQRHVKKLSQLLLRPSDKSHVPEALKKPVAALLESINLESQYTVDPKTGKRKKNGGGDPTKRTQAFQELRKVYAEIAGKGEDMVIDPSLFGSEADGIKGAFDAVIDMRDTRLSDMTQEQLETVWKVVRAVEHSITTAGRILSKTKYAATQDWARAVEQDTASRRSKRTLTEIGALKSLENPYTFFSHYGEAGHAVYRMLRNAQDKQQLMVDRIAQEVGKITDPKSVEQLEKTVHTFTTERGDSLTLSTAQVMELYELTKRKQAHEHLLKGGIVQPEIKSSKIRRGTNAVLLSEGDLANIIKVLSEEEMKLADALQGLTSGILAGYGNEASMTAYGYKKFTGTDYWPIRTAKEGVHSSSENNQNNTRSIKNIGLSKPTVPHASNALDIPGIFTTFSSHAGDMVDYAAWLVPMEDANRLFNYEYRDGQGNPTGRYVKGLLDRVGGAGSQEYWSRLMDNIQNGISAPMDDPMTRIAVKGIGSFKSAAVGGNLRVWLLQPTSLFRASFVLPAEDISRGLVKGATKGNGWKKALKYSPIAMRKDNGGFDISNPRSMKEQLFDGRSRIRKFNDALSAPAGIADAWAWGKLWNACEWTTARRHKELRAGSEAFYQKVNEMFTEVIDQTQVVDGILQRSNIMRSRNAIAQQATTFMGEPIMSLNMLLRAYDQFRYEQNPVKRGKAIKALGRASMALVLTSVASAVVQSFVDALRDDDKDKKHLERMLSAFTGLTGEEESAWEKAIAVVLNGNLIGNLNPIGQIPFARDILSQAQGYEVSRTDMEIFSDLVRATQTVIDSADGNGKRTRAYAVKELLSSAAKVFGTPVGNLTRDVWSIIRSFFIQTDNISLLYEMEKAIYNITNDGNRSRYVDILYRAYRSGESDTYESIYSDLVKNGMDPAKIASGMESRMKEDQGVTSVSDLEQRYLPPDKEKEYQSLLSGVSGTKIWAGATEEQRKNTSDDIYQLIMETDRSASLRDKISAGSQYGLTEEEMVLYELAKEVASQDGNDNTSQEEAAAAAAMLPGLSDNERAYLWQSTNKGWKDTNNPWK